MPKYYWESEKNHGQYFAENEEEAKKKKQKKEKRIKEKFLILYKESNTKNGLPFIEIK